MRFRILVTVTVDVLNPTALVLAAMGHVMDRDWPTEADQTEALEATMQSLAVAVTEAMDPFAVANRVPGLRVVSARSGSPTEVLPTHP